MNSTQFEELGSGFFHCPTPLKVFHGLANVGNQMALVRLTSGKFIALGTVDPSFPGVKEGVDRLTNNGADLEAVFATHPFHTLFFEPFHALYPDAKYYGTPRHIRNITSMKWAGSVADESIRNLYLESDGLDMRIPPIEVAEFDDPKPESSNHFNNLLVFHKPSKVFYNDDMMAYLTDASSAFGCCLTCCLGLKDDTVAFHPSIFKGGLRDTEEAYNGYIDFVDKLFNDWDFKVLATAHNSILREDPRQRLVEAFDSKYRPKLKRFADKKAPNQNTHFPHK